MAGAAGGGSHGCCMLVSPAVQPCWVLISTLGTSAANYPSSPVPMAWLASGSLFALRHWAEEGNAEGPPCCLGPFNNHYY